MALDEERLRAHLEATAATLNSLASEVESGVAARYRGAALFAERLMRELPQYRESTVQTPLEKIRKPVQLRVRRHAPETSFQAAVSQTPARSQELYRLIYSVLEECGPQTDDGIYALLAESGTTVTQNSLRPRRKELTEHGWVRDSGQKRPSHSGHPAIVWEAVPESISSARP